MLNRSCCSVVPFPSLLNYTFFLMKLKESAVVRKVVQSGSTKPNVLLLSALSRKSAVHHKTKQGEDCCGKLCRKHCYIIHNQWKCHHIVMADKQVTFQTGTWRMFTSLICISMNVHLIYKRHSQVFSCN